MPSLNDDVENDLNTDIDPSALIQQPVDTSHATKEVTFVTKVGSTKPQPNTDDLDIMEETPKDGQLPDLDAKFEIVDQQHVLVTDLKSVETMITNQNVISREDANLIESVYGSFFTSRLACEEFTHFKTKTNLPYALRFMQLRVSKEEMQFFDKFKVFFHEPMEDFCQFEHHYEKYYIPFVKDQLLNLRIAHNKVLTHIAESNNVVIPWGVDQKELVNVLTFLLRTELSEAVDKERDVATAFNNVRQLLESHEFIGFIKSVLSSGMSTVEWDTIANRGAYYENDLTLGQLIQFYQTNALDEALDSLLSKIKMNVSRFTELSTESGTIEQEFSVIDKFLLDTTSELKSINNSMQLLFETAKSFALLNISMNVILAYLKRCL